MGVEMSQLEDYAYLAGLVDGEGCISIAWTIPKKGHIVPRPFLVITLKHASREEKLLYQLKEKYGGRIVINDKPEGRTKVISWTLSRNKELRNLLTAIKPYLMLKREEAELVIEAINIMESDYEHSFLGYRKETILKVAEIYEKLKAFNPGRRICRKWSYEYIKNYIESSPFYKEEYRERIKMVRLENCRKYGFGSGRKLSKEVEERRLQSLRESAKRRRKYPDDVVRKARELYEQGVPMPQISKMLNVNYSSIWDWLKRGRRRDAV
jgi:hypothetical protein